MKLFELFATLSLDTKDFEKQVRSAESQSNSLASSMQSKLSAATVAVGGLMQTAVQKAASGIGDIVKKAFSLTAETEQQVGGSEAVWGEWADNIQATASRAFKTAGASYADYLAEANKMGSLLKGSGYTTAEAYQLTTDVMQRAADVASVMGIDVSSAMQAIEGAAKGNYTMMDNLGVSITENALSAYALEKGLTESTSAMTTQEKTALAFQLFMERTADYAGQYAKENDTLSGSMTTLGAAWENFLAGTGTEQDFTDALVSGLDVIVDKAAEVFPRLVESGVIAVQQLLPKIQEAFEDWGPIAAEAGAELIASIINGITGGDVTAQDVIDTVNSIIAVFETVAGWVNTAIGAIGEFFGERIPAAWTTMVEEVKEWWGGVVEKFNETITAIGNFFGQTIPQAWKDMVSEVGTWWHDKVIAPIQSSIDAVAEFLGLDAEKTVTVNFKTGGTAYGFGMGNSSFGGGTADMAFFDESGLLNRLPGFASGLSYVPYDNFVARLHKGEEVLTKEDAEERRRGGAMEIDYERMAAAVARAMAGVKISMDGREVGRAVAPTVSREIGKTALAGIFAR